MALESVVRPFQGRNKFSNKRIATKTSDPKVKSSGTNCTAALCWGDVGTKPTPIPDGLNVETNDCNEAHTEISGRNSDLLRIENPDDSSQYIMVRRPKTIYFKKQEHKQSSWNQLSLTAASIEAWQKDLEADLGFNNDDQKCGLKVTLNAPDGSSGTN